MLKNLLPTMRGENAIEHRLKTEALVTQNGINYAVRTDNIILSGNFTIRESWWLAAVQDNAIP